MDMKKCILLLSLTAISVSLLSQSTYKVDVYHHDRTVKFATYKPITETTVTPSQNSSSVPTSTNFLEEQVKQARLREEMAELEELRELRRQRNLQRQQYQQETNQSNRQNGSMFQINVPSRTQQRTQQNYDENTCFVYGSSPLYDIPNWTKGKSVTTSENGTARLISKYDDNYYWAEMNGIRGYLWTGWIKK